MPNFIVQFLSMGMEPDARAFFVQIIQTISMTVLWMLLNAYFGIKREYAFFEGSPGLCNYIYYPLFLASLVFLLWYLRNKWRDHF